MTGLHRIPCNQYKEALNRRAQQELAPEIALDERPAEDAPLDVDRVEGLALPKAKEVEGKVTNDKAREAGGKGQGILGKAKDKLSDAKDAVKDTVDNVKGKLDKDDK